METTNSQRRLLTTKKLPTSKENLYRRFDAFLQNTKAHGGTHLMDFDWSQHHASVEPLETVYYVPKEILHFHVSKIIDSSPLFTDSSTQVDLEKGISHWNRMTPNIQELRLTLEHTIPLGVPQFYQTNPQWSAFITPHKTTPPTGNSSADIRIRDALQRDEALWNTHREDFGKFVDVVASNIVHVLMRVADYQCGLLRIALDDNHTLETEAKAAAERKAIEDMLIQLLQSESSQSKRRFQEATYDGFERSSSSSNRTSPDTAAVAKRNRPNSPQMAEAAISLASPTQPPHSPIQGRSFRTTVNTGIQEIESEEEEVADRDGAEHHPDDFEVSFGSEQSDQDEAEVGMTMDPSRNTKAISFHDDDDESLNSKDGGKAHTSTPGGSRGNRTATSMGQSARMGAKTRKTRKDIGSGKATSSSSSSSSGAGAQADPDTFDRSSPLQPIDLTEPLRRASPAYRDYIRILRDNNEHNGFISPIHGTAYARDGQLHRMISILPIDHGQSLLCAQDNHPTHLDGILQHGDEEKGGLYATKDLSAHYQAHAPLPNPSCPTSIGAYLDQVERIGTGPPRYPVNSVSTEVLVASIREKAFQEVHGNILKLHDFSKKPTPTNCNGAGNEGTLQDLPRPRVLLHPQSRTELPPIPRASGTDGMRG